MEKIRMITLFCDTFAKSFEENGWADLDIKEKWKSLKVLSCELVVGKREIIKVHKFSFQKDVQVSLVILLETTGQVSLVTLLETTGIWSSSKPTKWNGA